MNTYASSPDASEHAATDVMMTTDIDFTADLAEPPVAPTTHFQRMPKLARTTAASVTSHGSQRARPLPESAPTPTDARLPIAPGRVLCDRYVLTQLIGTGGMCTVFRARDLEATPSSGRPAFIALKTPRPDYVDQARAIERLKREFEYAHRLSHSGIVQVFELANEGDIWFMTMELLEGESLAALIRAQATALTPYLARRVVRGIADALAYAHAAGVAHGDLNPANVIVLAGERIKLIDFAAACREGERPSAAATLAYASPQVIEGQTPEPRDDIFSFATIAHEAITGRHPFEQRPSTIARTEGMVPQACSKFSSEQWAELASALSFDREARPTNAKSLATTLAPDPQRIRTIGFDDDLDLQPLPSHSRSDKSWWVFAAVCLLAMVGAVVFTRLA